MYKILIITLLVSVVKTDGNQANVKNYIKNAKNILSVCYNDKNIVSLGNIL